MSLAQLWALERRPIRTFGWERSYVSNFNSPILETSINSNIRWIPNNFLLHVYDFFSIFNKKWWPCHERLRFPRPQKTTWKPPPRSSTVKDRFPVGWHPHLGMDIMTYIREGRGRHADSLGNREELLFLQRKTWTFEVRGANSEKI